MARLHKDRNGPRTREEILNLVRATQGLTKTELTQRIGLAWGTVHYHLRVLYNERHLIAKRHFGWHRIYTADRASEEMRSMTFMRLPVVNEIVDRVCKHPGVGIQALSGQMGLSRMIVRRHLMRLVEIGILERSEHYRPRFFVRGYLQLSIKNVENPKQPSACLNAAHQLRDDLVNRAAVATPTAVNAVVTVDRSIAD